MPSKEATVQAVVDIRTKNLVEAVAAHEKRSKSNWLNLLIERALGSYSESQLDAILAWYVEEQRRKKNSKNHHHTADESASNPGIGGADMEQGKGEKRQVFKRVRVAKRAKGGAKQRTQTQTDEESDTKSH